MLPTVCEVTEEEFSLLLVPVETVMEVEELEIITPSARLKLLIVPLTGAYIVEETFL